MGQSVMAAEYSYYTPKAVNCSTKDELLLPGFTFARRDLYREATLANQAVGGFRIELPRQAELAPKKVAALVQDVGKFFNFSLKYTPREFLEANWQGATYLVEAFFQKLREKNDCKQLITFGERVSVDSLKEWVDKQVSDVSYIKRVLEQYRIGTLEYSTDEWQRSSATCGLQSRLLKLAHTDKKSKLLRADTRIHGIYHEFLVAVPTSSLSDLQFFRHQNDAIFSPTIFKENDSLLDYRAIIIIDPTFMQFIRGDMSNKNLIDGELPVSERFSLVRERFPANITQKGVFVGNVVEYVKLLAFLGEFKTTLKLQI